MRSPWLGRPGWGHGLPPSGDVVPTWIDLASPDGTYTPGTAVGYTVGDQEADGWHNVTVTGAGTVRDAYDEQAFLLYQPRDQFRRAVSLSSTRNISRWVMEIDGPGDQEGANVMTGVGFFGGTMDAVTSVERVLLAGFNDDAVNLHYALLNGTSVSTTTSSAPDARRLDCLWLPDLTPATPEVGGISRRYSEPDGTKETGTSATYFTATVDPSDLWAWCLALGTDTTSTNPDTVRIRAGFVSFS